ncbi:MAG: lytic transglycosylase domain-containing protein [Pseudomonadota bacterium]
MITSQAFAVCIFAAAQTYAVPPSVLIGILNVEGGRVGQAVHNPNNTYSLGPMHINTLWIPELARFWDVSEQVALNRVRDDACVNVGIGAYILRSKIDETGSLSEGVAHYRSSNPQLGDSYRAKVVSAMKKYESIHSPDDLVPSIRSPSEDPEKISNREDLEKILKGVSDSVIP